ncbi:hypothetical protein [Roseomonas sp. HF4]|uniref:hypothetical protein n=1 Tax=Roseomonas sp. HF4 TaxID=2562313 RepID=UPI001484F443|nr:hypothetical protein [Roseomonas sp. HF4]
MSSFWAGRAQAEIQVNLRLFDRTGAQVYSRVYTGQGEVPSLQLATGSNAVIALQGGLERLVQAVLEDRAFVAALLATAPASEPTRVRAPRAGRPAA